MDILAGDRVVELNGTPLADVEHAPASIISELLVTLEMGELCLGLQRTATAAAAGSTGAPAEAPALPSSAPAPAPAQKEAAAAKAPARRASLPARGASLCCRVWSAVLAYVRRLLSLIVLWVLVAHWIFAPFFLLPWDTRTRAQALGWLGLGLGLG